MLTAEILHQLIDSLSHSLQGLYIPGAAGFQPSTVVGGFSPPVWKNLLLKLDHVSQVGVQKETLFETTT